MAKTDAPLPDDFALTDDRRRWAKLNAPLVDVDMEFGTFVDWARGGGKKYADWEATWRNWLRREQKRLKEKQKPWERAVTAKPSSPSGPVELQGVDVVAERNRQYVAGFEARVKFWRREHPDDLPTFHGKYANPDDMPDTGSARRYLEQLRAWVQKTPPWQTPSWLEGFARRCREEKA